MAVMTWNIYIRSEYISPIMFICSTSARIDVYVNTAFLLDNVKDLKKIWVFFLVFPFLNLLTLMSSTFYRTYDNNCQTLETLYLKFRGKF